MLRPTGVCPVHTEGKWIASFSGPSAREVQRYDFRAPWIALNQENHLRFKDLDRPDRRQDLDRLLVGNLLTMSQAFGWFFSRAETIFAAFEPTREFPTTVKGVSLIGFDGASIYEHERGMRVGARESAKFVRIELTMIVASDESSKEPYYGVTEPGGTGRSRSTMQIASPSGDPSGA